jgi:uncharacterized protein
MIAYVDASVLLRVALGQRDALREWHDIERGVSSSLVRVESLRSLDRLRIRAKLSDSELANRRAMILKFTDAFEMVEISSAVLERAAQPMPTELGTLDAIHLATALLWRELVRADLVMATHDRALAIASQAHGLPVLGIGQ